MRPWRSRLREIAWPIAFLCLFFAGLLVVPWALGIETTFCNDWSC